MNVPRPIVWQTVRIIAACAIAEAFSALAGLKEGYWALVTAVVVTQPALDDTLTASKNRILGTLVGAAAGFVVLELAQHGLARAPLFWLALLPLAVLTAYQQSLRLSCITLIIVVLVPSSAGLFARPLDRVFGILLGTAASILVAEVIRTSENK
jgi:uncharacterized membrane protein YccC